MGTKSFAAAAGAALITTFSLPIAYHSRDVDFFPDDKYNITHEPDGDHLHVVNSRMEEVSDIRLIQNEDGELVGQGVVHGDEFEVVVTDPNSEAVFIHDHGAEKMWLGRDVVHVQPGDNASDMQGSEPCEPGF